MSNICRQKWKFRICEQSKVRTRKIQSWSTGPTRSSVHVRTCRCPRMHSPMPSFILGLAGRANSNAKYTRYTEWWKIRKIHRVAENTQGTQNSAKYASYTEQWKCAVALPAPVSHFICLIHNAYGIVKRWKSLSANTIQFIATIKNTKV